MCRRLLVKLSNIKFRENMFSIARVVTFGQTGRTKLIGAFLKILVAPKTVRFGLFSFFMVPDLFELVSEKKS